MRVEPLLASIRRRTWCALSAWWVATAIGCTAGMVETPDLLPVRNAVKFDQLAIHSNFPLPMNHRLLEDLRQQRGEVVSRLNLPPSEKPINVYLFDTEVAFDRFMREHHPDFPQRRAFFVESGGRLAVYAQWGERVAEDLRHEVAHGYLHSAVAHLPLWLDEGLAEFFEVPHGTQGLNPPHVQLLLGKLLTQGWRPNLERLEGLASAGDMTQDDYAEAWLWAHWLLETADDRRATLHGYLRSLAQPGNVAPLSQTLRASHPQPEQQLVEHLYSLAPRP